MEASDTSGQEPGTQPEGDAPAQDAQQPEQSQDDSQPESPAPAQEEPAADSNLTTEQPDQPVQSEPERQEQPEGPTAEAGPSGQPAEGTVAPARDHAADEAQRQSELAAQRDEHNQRTGGGETQANELQDQRQEHNDRTGGGEVPGASSDQ